MRFFRSRAFSAGNAAIFLTFASLFGAVFFYAQLLQTGLGYGPLDAGLRLMPWTATFITVAPIAGALVDRIGERPFMVGGLLAAGGRAGVAGADRRAGHGVLADARAVHRRRRRRLDGDPGRAELGPRLGRDDALGKAAGANSMMRELGGVFGIAVVVAVFAGAGSYASAQRSPTASRRRSSSRRGSRSPARSPAWRCPAAARDGGGDRSSTPAFRRQRPMRQVMVRYKVKPDRAAENEELVRAVYEELHRTGPAGLRYATFRLDDGVSFVHLASRDRGRAQPAVARWRRSQRFQENIGDRCDEAPAVTELREIGSFHLSMARLTHARAGRRHHPVVHLELHTGDLARASAFYSRLLRWRPERIDAGCGSYHALELGGGFGGGIVECGTRRPLWLPYVEVDRVDEVTDRAGRLGASVLLEPREGPAGWRSVVATPEGGEIAFWQPKGRCGGGGAPDVTRARAARRRPRGDEDAFGRLVEPHRAELRRPLLPDARLGPRRRGRAAGGAAARLARPAAVRGPQLAAHVALHDRDQRLPEGDRAAAQAGAPDRLRPGRRPARRRPPSRSSSRCGSSPTRTSGSASRTRLAGPEARYEQRESVELAFIAALQHLPARQRAVLILRDVLGFSGQEVAEALETTPASVYSALQRAHKTVDERLPEHSQQATLRALGDERRCARSSTASSPRGSAATSTRSPPCWPRTPIIAMPPMPTWYAGREAVAGFLRRRPLASGRRWRLVPARASGQLAFGHYLGTERRAASPRTASTCSRCTAVGSPRSRRSSTPTCSGASACAGEIRP